METTVRIPLVWGLICFALLYQTFPTDIFYSWNYFHHYQGYYPQLVGQWVLQLTSPLVPLICFIAFYRKQVVDKKRMLLIPVFAWLASKVFIALILYGIGMKLGEPEFLAEGLLSMFKRLYPLEWFLRSGIYAITIVACSYAFWRESQTVSNATK